MTLDTQPELVACEVPLIEQLRDIPKDARLIWTESDGLQATHCVPIGNLAHEAADALERALPISCEDEVERVARAIWSAPKDQMASHYGSYTLKMSLTRDEVMRAAERAIAAMRLQVEREPNQ